MEVKVNSDSRQVVDWELAIIDRGDIIVHNTKVCQSKYFRLSRAMKVYPTLLSVGEIADKIMMDEI